MQSLTLRISLGALLVLAPALLGGCAVGRVIGDAVSSAYRNTVAYFNIYYNAERLFVQAEEEILAAETAARSKSPRSLPASVPVSAAARQKFTTVIDKCSKILSLHSESALVDDALLLIGKSYYYIGENLKAERKFAELLLQNPEGLTALEGQLWLLKTLERQGKHAEAMVMGEDLMARAAGEEEEVIAGRAAAMLGAVTRSEGNVDRALEYYGRSQQWLSGEERADAMARTAELQRLQGDLERAVTSYDAVLEMTSDPVRRFDAGVQLIRIEGELGRFEPALRRSDELLEDYLLLPYVKEIRLERAAILALQGRAEEAVAEYTDVDTTSSRTDVGVRAAYALGGVLERQLQDYSGARAAYARALAVNVPEITPAARAREAALGRYLALWQQRSKIDSTLAALEQADGHPEIDSTGAALPVMSRDSLLLERSLTAFQLAELFASEMEVPDSALAWYDHVISADTNRSRRSRSIFVTAELLADRSDSERARSRSLYEQLLSEDPQSQYASIARVRLGRTEEREPDDPLVRRYARAESDLEEGRVEDALREFISICRDHPASELAPQGLYAAGWIYEHRLGQPDSALAQYRALVERYGSSRYAQAVRQRIGAPAPADTVSRTAPQGPADREAKHERVRAPERARNVEGRE